MAGTKKKAVTRKKKVGTARKKTTAKRKTSTSKTADCKVSKKCSTFGKKLREEHSTPAARGLNVVCKPQKKARKKRGCLSGVGKDYIEVLVRIPKAKLRAK